MSSEQSRYQRRIERFHFFGLTAKKQTEVLSDYMRGGIFATVGVSNNTLDLDPCLRVKICFNFDHSPAAICVSLLASPLPSSPASTTMI